MHIYQPLKVNMVQFISFWSQRYYYEMEEIYVNNIGLELTEERILWLYLWKNGTPLSERKKKSVKQNFIMRRHDLIQFEGNFDARDFLNYYADGGAIWRIFWLHCYRPDQYPIYDQHVHRAMHCIENGTPQEIPQYNQKKIDTYIGSYLPFYEKFADFDKRDVDKALWAFGKFIKENNFPMPE